MTDPGRQVLAVLWGKSNAGGRPNLLLQHLLDTAAVAELIWDHYLAPALRIAVEECCGGAGRALFSLVCGLHDVGKASPAFQVKDDRLAARVRSAGLTWQPLGSSDVSWHHTLAGAYVIRKVLGEAGWGAASLRWIAPIIAGHHGMMPAVDHYGERRRPLRGQGNGPAWESAQRDLVHAVAAALDVDLSRAAPTGAPARAVQLAFSGAVIMADWIASGDFFGGVEDLDDVSMVGARQRAERAWQRLGLRGGWRNLPVPAGRSGRDLVRERFGRAARPVQAAAVELAAAMPAAGLLLIEAPMGEGKTEAALAAAEVQAARFGADGVFVGMPTQATSDAMFSRVLDWARAVDPQTPIGLLHGKSRFNRQWHDLRRQVRFAGIDDTDEYGCAADPYGLPGPGGGPAAAMAPCEWFLGPKRGMLTPVTVGTIDQLLHAATRTRHVMLRHVGLAGRVVVLDEVHAYDVYMMQFLTEALRWLGNAWVPVVLLSATLPPATRSALAVAYLQGMLRTLDVPAPEKLEAVAGYPGVRAVTAVDGRLWVDGRAAPPWRASIPVAVEILDEAPAEAPDRVVAVVRAALADGGCALVVRNTVDRAQRTYRAMCQACAGDDVDVVLLHARLVMGERVARTASVLDRLGPPSGAGEDGRRRRLIVVATQVAEQSFDVDVDLLVTDLAPIDLLLQRIGRVHRHDRPAGARPPQVAAARVVVAGMAGGGDGAPVFPPGGQHVYRQYPLLRAAALVRDAAAAGGWSIPAEVPGLVRSGYGDAVIEPASWQDTVAAAREEWHAEQRRREDAAEQYLLAGPDQVHRGDLGGLHVLPAREVRDEEAVVAMVRDGPESVEVVLVRRDGDLRSTLDGYSLGPSDTAVSDPAVAEAVLASTLRLPSALTAAAKAELFPLRESGGDPWLGRTRVLDLDLDAAGTAVLGGYRLSYHHDLGLVHERAT